MDYLAIANALFLGTVRYHSCDLPGTGTSVYAAGKKSSG